MPLRTLSGWIALSLVVVLSACGSDDDPPADTASTNAGTTDTGAADTGTSDDAGGTDAATDAATDTAADTPPPPSDVEVAADWLTGDFNSRAQSQADRRYFDVHLYAIQIWSERDDGVWMYVQQSRDDNDDGTYEAPYRQRVYRVHDDNGGVTSTVYRINDEDRYADPWDDLSVLDGLTEDALVLAEGCDVMLTRDGDRFVGGTEGTDCRLSFGGYATSSVTMTADGLESLDLLYDDQGNIINGLTEDSTPYMFDKTENFPVE